MSVGERESERGRKNFIASNFYDGQCPSIDEIVLATIKTLVLELRNILY